MGLACGTGQWTKLLGRRCTTVTAIDASPEVLALARRRVPVGVTWRVADLFSWEPERRWDTVFFAFWLSHVPWARWPDFWDRVRRSLAPGGLVAVLDERADAVENVETWADEHPDVAIRTLAGGGSFRIVKLRLTEHESPTSLTHSAGRVTGEMWATNSCLCA